MEAPIGFEPMHKGFADLSLTTWVRRPTSGEAIISQDQRLSLDGGGKTLSYNPVREIVLPCRRERLASLLSGAKCDPESGDLHSAVVPTAHAGRRPALLPRTPRPSSIV